MPAKSEAQRRYLAAHFGPAWMRDHGYDNSGKLPARVGKGKAVKKKAMPKPKKKAMPKAKKKAVRRKGY